jgi:hypothetical protein
MKKITECSVQKLKWWNSDDSSNTFKGKNNALDLDLYLFSVYKYLLLGLYMYLCALQNSAFAVSADAGIEPRTV